eukprot:CAMPEP_0183590546 /NCGR_PEP_ID=MMETSP0371-20130417/164736_1 /TAXON_ID=268820 /ORGANISM="Peridinium aciculiferum, Strain PAER-2" /LENGTH=154 /DNA_ID=CAMNT_0025801955 /DNA_START=30 /DNA_END=494 /DNA_ORIENTATION=+
MMFYQMWLASEAAAVMSPIVVTDGVGEAQVCIRFTLCVAAILALGLGALEVAPGAPGSDLESSRQALLAQPDGGGAAGAGPAVPPAMSDVERRNFAVQCFAHAVVPLYVCESLVAFGPEHQHALLAQVAVAFFCPFLYGWSLVAPKLLPNRSFS